MPNMFSYRQDKVLIDVGDDIWIDVTDVYRLELGLCVREYPAPFTAPSTAPFTAPATNVKQEKHEPTLVCEASVSSAASDSPVASTADSIDSGFPLLSMACPANFSFVARTYAESVSLPPRSASVPTPCSSKWQSDCNSVSNSPSPELDFELDVSLADQSPHESPHDFAQDVDKRDDAMSVELDRNDNRAFLKLQYPTLTLFSDCTEVQRSVNDADIPNIAYLTEWFKKGDLLVFEVTELDQPKEENEFGFVFGVTSCSPGETSTQIYAIRTTNYDL